MDKQAYIQSVSRVLDKGMQKQAEGSIAEGVGNLGKATVYIIGAISALAGAGLGVLGEKATEPTDTDVGNAQKAYAIANLEANIDSQYKKLKDEKRYDNKARKSMRIGL